MLTVLSAASDEANAAITVGELPTIIANEVQLAQVFKNLIGNAIKYCSPTEPPAIKIWCEATTDQWAFCVEDNGLGIPSESIQHIFDPFTRVHEETGISGTGIGLSFCQRIIKNHHGRIWVEPAESRGSKFFFEIPKKIPSSESLGDKA